MLSGKIVFLGLEPNISPRSRSTQTLRVGDQPITVIKAERLDSNRTLYRVNIEPVGDLPPTIIVKQQKEGWAEEFQRETEAYAIMKDLQGNVIPQFFGRGDFDGVPALFLSEIVGITLYDLARSNKSVDVETMKSQLQAAFRSLSAYGAIYWDQRLDNFLLCDNGDCNNSKVMVVDLEQIQFPATFRPWQLNVNQEGARSLMEDFRDIRHPDREPSPVRFWGSDAGNRHEERAKERPERERPNSHNAVSECGKAISRSHVISQHERRPREGSPEVPPVD